MWLCLHNLDEINDSNTHIENSVAIFILESSLCVLF